MTVIQRRNADMAGLLKADLQGRYEPNFAVANALSTMLLLPELRGLWPMSSVDESGNVRDISGQGRTLTNNAPRGTIFSGLVPYISTNGTIHYAFRSNEAGLSITGQLTFGGWFYFNSLGTANLEGIIGKHNSTGNQRSYSVYLTPSNTAQFQISADGTPTIEIQTATITANRWYFLVGRFTPSSEVAIFCNDSKNTVNAGVPSSLFNSTAAFEIMRRNIANTYVNGRATLCFLCAYAIPDVIINNLFQQTRAAFNA